MRLPRDHKFVFPDYTGFGVVNLGPTILDKYRLPQLRRWPVRMCHNRHWRSPHKKKTLVIIVDGLGKNHLEHYQKPFRSLKTLVELADFYPLTTGCFSTTPLMVPSMQSAAGYTPQQGHVVEFAGYHPAVDDIIHPITGSSASDPEPGSLYRDGVLKPSDLYPHQTVYEALAAQSIPAYAVVPKKFIGSPFNSQIQRGAQFVGYNDFDELVQGAVRTLESTVGDAVVYVYIGDIDTASHRDGPESEPYTMLIDAVATAIVQLLEHLPKTVAEETVVLITSDHGQVPVKQERIIWLDQYPLVDQSRRTTSRGRLTLGGAPDDAILYLEPQQVDEVYAFLCRVLEGKAWVVRSGEALELGLFGLGQPTPEFVAGLGDIIIFGLPDHQVWWEEFYQKGIHGGLKREVMNVFLLLIDPLRAHRRVVPAVINSRR